MMTETAVSQPHHCLLPALTGNHMMCSNFLTCSCFGCLHFYLADKTQNTDMVTVLTRPAIGVDSLFTFLMMPGFSRLIKLQTQTT